MIDRAIPAALAAAALAVLALAQVRIRQRRHRQSLVLNVGAPRLWPQ